MEAAGIPYRMSSREKLTGAALSRAAFWRLTAIPLALAALGLAIPAEAQSPLIQGWLAVNMQCKAGPSGNPKVEKACKRRDDLSERLKRRGCVYQSDGDWWRCPH